MSEITGVTFPVPKNLMPRFFKDGKTVFIKPATIFKALKPGMKLIFYQSHEDTGYVGEATIRRIVINDNPLAFFETFGDVVFLTRDETETYVASQERWQGVRVRKGEAKRWVYFRWGDTSRIEIAHHSDDMGVRRVGRRSRTLALSRLRRCQISSHGGRASPECEGGGGRPWGWWWAAGGSWRGPGRAGARGEGAAALWTCGRGSYIRRPTGRVEERSPAYGARQGKVFPDQFLALDATPSRHPAKYE